jgi:hypothetical protein
MCDHDAVNCSVRRNGNVVDDLIDRVAQIFEAGNKTDIELTIREPLTQCRWMIKHNVAWPAANQRTSVDVLYAADAQRVQRET